jgi:hypothetical protein
VLVPWNRISAPLCCTAPVNRGEPTSLTALSAKTDVASVSTTDPPPCTAARTAVAPHCNWVSAKLLEPAPLTTMTITLVPVPRVGTAGPVVAAEDGVPSALLVAGGMPTGVLAELTGELGDVTGDVADDVAGDVAGDVGTPPGLETGLVATAGGLDSGFLVLPVHAVTAISDKPVKVAASATRSDMTVIVPNSMEIKRHSRNRTRVGRRLHSQPEFNRVPC